MAHIEGLPGIGDSQEIGQDATRCLHTNAPLNWVTPKDLGGTDDYGLDFQVQLKAKSQAAAIFRLQLKGSRGVTFIEGGKFISIGLSASTLRYYQNIAEPILLVVCDLNADPDSRKCPLYYVWVRPELRRIRVDSLDADAGKVKVHVPTANRLTDNLDLLPEVRAANELAEAGHALDVRVAELRPELHQQQRVEIVHDVTEGFGKRSAAFLEAVAAPVVEHWPKPEPGTLAADLMDAAKQLRVGRLDRASKSLESAATRLGGATPTELGEFSFLRGRHAMLSGEDDTASAEFKKAAQITGQSKHWAAFAESELRRRFDPDDRDVSKLDFSDVLAQLPPATDPVLAAAKARLLAASNRPGDARAALDGFSGAESMAGLAVVESMNGQFEAAIQACEVGLSDTECSESTRLLFQILRARGRYHLALATATRTIEEEIVPPSGPPGVDARLLRQAWTEMLMAVDSMEEVGWASNSEFVADVLAACSSMLGKQKDALTILASATKKRPGSQGLNAALEVIAAQCGDFKLALEANARLPKSDTQTLRRIAFLYEVGGQQRQCVALMEREVSKLRKDHQLFGAVVVLAARAANAFARHDLVKAWTELLESDSSLRPHAAALRYYASLADSPLSAVEELFALAERHRDLGKPLPTAIVLFEEADPSDEKQARLIVELSAEVKAHSRLAPGMSVHVGMALVTLDEWAKLLELCDEAEREFDGNPRLLAFKGLALDRLGNTEGARQALKAMLDGGIADSLALKTYVNIMVRCGFFDEAAEAAEQMLDAAKTDAQRRECVRLLFNLVQIRDPHAARLVDLALRIGELSDPESEVEEGVFLAMVLAGTSTSHGSISPEKQKEISQRADAFFARYPDSKVLRRIDTGDSPEDLLQRLKEISGVTEERQRAQVRIEREMRDGKLPIPFAWRPRLAFPNIRDQLHLWEVAKRASPDDRQFHLMMEVSDWKAKRAADLRDKVPLVDLVTLFVLYDLDLLEDLFKQFSQIAIAQGTLAELSNLCQVFSGSPWRHKCLDLQGKLRAKFSRIVQPIALVDGEDDEDERAAPVPSQEIKKLCADGGYFLYSDDAVFRVLCLGQATAQRSMSTLDLLEVLDERELIDPNRAAKAIAKLCSWNVGIVILRKHQLAAVPSSALNARTISASVDALHADPDFMAVASGMWDFRSDFKRNVSHVASIVRELVNEPSVDTLVTAAFAGVWFVKAKLRDEAPRPPLSMLAQLILRVASLWVRYGSTTKPDAPRRLRQVFLYLVELEFGDRMDENVEKKALEELALRAVDVDFDLQELDSPLRTWLIQGFEPGTAMYAAFSDAYTRGVTAHVMKSQKE